MRSVSNKRVFAVGDIADPAGIGPRAFTHVGSYHAGIVIRRALFRLPARIDYAALPRVTYTDPELAQTGLTEAEALAAGHEGAGAALAAGRQRPRRRPNATPPGWSSWWSAATGWSAPASWRRMPAR